jgi:hypothetical protein
MQEDLKMQSVSSNKMSDIPAFVRTLLSTSPKAPHDVQLEMDVEGDSVALYEAFLQIFIDILKHWYAPPIQFAKITEDHWRTLKQYFASFGVRIHVDESECPAVVRINNKSYETKRDLKEMHFQVTSGPSLYTIWFELF